MNMTKLMIIMMAMITNLLLFLLSLMSLPSFFFLPSLSLNFPFFPSLEPTNPSFLLTVSCCFVPSTSSLQFPFLFFTFIHCNFLLFNSVPSINIFSYFPLLPTLMFPTLNSLFFTYFSSIFSLQPTLPILSSIPSFLSILSFLSFPFL